MATIKNILIPTDFSETAILAIAHGAKMAQLFKAKIFLLHSVETTLYTAGVGEPVMMPDIQDIYKEATEQLNKTAEALKTEYAIDIAPIIANGRPAAAIASAVKENNIDIIIMGTHGASGFEELFMGSNAHKVVTIAPCPVITIRLTTKTIGFANIILPIGSYLHSRQKVNNAIELAKVYGSTVHILGLLETNDKEDDSKFAIKIETVEHALNHANIKYTKKIIRATNPAVEAMKFSEEINGDLILIMTEHESDLTGMFLGASAKQIVNHSKIPVMSIRPEETMIETFSPDGGTGTL